MFVNCEELVDSVPLLQVTFVDNFEWLISSEALVTSNGPPIVELNSLTVAPART